MGSDYKLCHTAALAFTVSETRAVTKLLKVSTLVLVTSVCNARAQTVGTHERRFLIPLVT